MGNDKEQLKLLEEFLLDSELLDGLEEELSNFNVFETLGIISTEIRHSNVLAWLLDPKENHGIGDLFLKNLLKTIFHENKSSLNIKLNLIDISLMDFSNFRVAREWNNIDLLLVSDKDELVMAIENKVDSKEHGDQLKRYFGIINNEYKTYEKIFIYLTPQGDTPSDENWSILNYQTIAEIIDKVIKLRGDALNIYVKSFITQYLTVLRRYVVGNSKIEKTCREIYFKHRKALDLIFQYKPDIYLEISETINLLVRESNLLLDDHGGKSNVRFTTEILDGLIERKGEGWTNSKRILLFEFDSRPDRLVLRLVIGPGEDETRNKLYRVAQKDKKLFNKSKRNLGKKWFTIYQKDYISSRDYDELDEIEIKEKIASKFKTFASGDLIEIEEFFKNNL